MQWVKPRVTDITASRICSLRNLRPSFLRNRPVNKVALTKDKVAIPNGSTNENNVMALITSFIFFPRRRFQDINLFGRRFFNGSREFRTNKHLQLGQFLLIICDGPFILQLKFKQHPLCIYQAEKIYCSGLVCGLGGLQ